LRKLFIVLSLRAFYNCRRCIDFYALSDRLSA
jgi:hypothetical protein